MDRYAHRLYDWLESTDPGFEVRLAAQIGALTRETKDGRRSGGYPRWWAQDVDPTSLVLPGPLRDPQRYVARYFFYPWWLKRGARRAGARARRLAHAGGGVRGAARGEHGGAEKRPARDPDRGAAAQRSGRVPAPGGGALHRRPGAAHRATGAAPLRAHRPVRRRDDAATRLSRGRRAAVPFPL